MVDPVELRDVRRRAEELARTGEFPASALVFAAMRQTTDAALLREFVQQPLSIAGIDNVCRLSRRA